MTLKSQIKDWVHPAFSCSTTWWRIFGGQLSLWGPGIHLELSFIWVTLESLTASESRALFCFWLLFVIWLSWSLLVFYLNKCHNVLGFNSSEQMFRLKIDIVTVHGHKNPAECNNNLFYPFIHSKKPQARCCSTWCVPTWTLLRVTTSGWSFRIIKRWWWVIKKMKEKSYKSQYFVLFRQATHWSFSFSHRFG